MAYRKLNSRKNLFTGDIIIDVDYCNFQIKIFVNENGKFDYVDSSDYVSSNFALAIWTTKGYKLQEDISR